MTNSGCGLCIELAHDDRTDRSLYVKLHRMGNDVEVSAKENAPYVVAKPATGAEWSHGRYFATLDEATKYLTKGAEQ